MHTRPGLLSSTALYGALKGEARLFAGQAWWPRCERGELRNVGVI